MIWLKKLDAFVQLFLFIVALMLIYWDNNNWLFLSYFIIGGWQLISVIVMKLLAVNMPSVFHRGYYLKTLMVLAGLGLVVLIVPIAGLYYFLGLIWIAPIMAVWYIIITWLELKLWQRRILIQLK